MQDCIDHGKLGTKEGYSYLRQPKTRKQILRHRYAYCIYHGIDLSTIEGKVVRHTCDNPRCINPLHLLLGTHADNVRDKVERNRQRKGVEQPNSRLTDEIVRAIRLEYVPRCKEHGTRAIARRLGVSHRLIHLAISGKRWRHVI